MENRLKVWDLHPSSSAGIGFHLRLGCDFTWFYVLWLGDVMLWCCDVAGPRMGEKIVLSDRARLSSDFKLSRNLSDQWFQISTCRWMGWGLHTWPGRRKYNPGCCWWEWSLVRIVMNWNLTSNRNKSVPIQTLWIDEAHRVTSNMSPFSAYCNSKYSLYPKYGSMSMVVFWHPKHLGLEKRWKLTSNRGWTDFVRWRWLTLNLPQYHECIAFSSCLAGSWLMPRVSRGRWLQVRYFLLKHNVRWRFFSGKLASTNFQGGK